MKRNPAAIAFLLLALVAAAGCIGADAPPAGAAASHASAPLERVDPDGTRPGVAGYANFTESAGALSVHVVATGLAPGAHGIHVHERGDCGPTPAREGAPAVAAGRAGGHYNPTNASHGAHAGDLGNVNADEAGRVNVTRSPLNLTLAEIMGRAFVIHARGDDGESVASAGARVLCGVIAARDADAPDP